jgi:hypothetical protein
MERYCSTGQSPQRAVAPTEGEEGFLCSLFSGYIILAFVCPSVDEGLFVLFLTRRAIASYFAL